MSGETDLDRLVSSMAPKLTEPLYVFCTLQEARYGDYRELEPIASFGEEEGLTLIIEKAAAERAGLAFDGLFRRITLQVHSSLEAVGLTATVSAALTEVGISANVVAAYYHDHLFVPAERAEEALAVLSGLGNV